MHNFKVLLFILPFANGVLDFTKCPFPAFPNPGLQCNKDVTSESSKVDQLVEKIHYNNVSDSCLITHVECDKNSPFRTYSGYCNNLNDPSKGGAFSLYRRKLANDYEDGISVEKKTGPTGNVLPNARNISRQVNYLLPNSSAGMSIVHNHFLTMFTQFLGHDFVYTPIVPAREECGICDPVAVDCMPIQADPTDFRTFKNKCMPFARSVDGNTDPNNPERKQINLISSYIDASNVYGTDTETAAKLRENSGGRLKTQDNGRLMPQLDPSPDGIGCSPQTPAKSLCVISEPCFLSGDDRNGENMGLNSIHHLWVHEHNRIAKTLEEKTNWNDEQIFQRTRQIIIAMIQHVTYGEVLPILLNDETMTAYDLKEPVEGDGSHFNGYDDTCDTTPFTEFATAAYRFGHSMIHYRVNVAHHDGTPTQPIRMESNWYNVQWMKNDTFAPIGIIEDMFKKPMHRRDRHFVIAVYLHLLEIMWDGNKFLPALDLNALNIQRGRDHGLQGYNAYREAYGLEKLSQMEDIFTKGIGDRNLTDAFKQAYGENVDDIDLFTGIVSENEVSMSTEYGIMGPLGGKMLAEQFKQFKYCDRYFYSGSPSTNPGAFTSNQLKEIRRIGLSNIVCHHAHPETQVHKNGPFFISSQGVNRWCPSLIQMDYNYFIDPNYTGYPVGTQHSDSRFTRIPGENRLRRMKPMTLDYCDRLCYEETQCLGYDYRHSIEECVLYKSLDTMVPKYGNKPDYTLGIPDRNLLTLNPVFPTHTEDKEKFTLTPKRCILEENGANDVGATFTIET